MGICYIVAAGDMNTCLPKIEKDDLLIAADAGYLHLKKLNIEPNILLGDFDSMQVPEDKQVLLYPVMKDDTDTMLAIKLGFEKGFKEFKIYGALGGDRTDHTVANLQALGFIAENGGIGTLVGDNESFTVIKNSEITLDGKGKGFSIFAFGGVACGVSEKGSLFELDNAELSPYFPLGVSNKFIGTPVKIEVKKGCLLIITRG